MVERINNEYIEMLKSTPIYDQKNNINLKPFNGSEGVQYIKWFDRETHPEVMQYLYENTPFTTDPLVKVGAEEFITYVVKNPKCIYYRIEHPEHGFIGHLSLNGIDYQEMSCSIGYLIGEQQLWGKGIATAIVETAIPYLKSMGFKILKANAHKENKRSRTLLSKFFNEVSENETSVDYELEI